MTLCGGGMDIFWNHTISKSTLKPVDSESVDEILSMTTLVVSMTNQMKANKQYLPQLGELLIMIFNMVNVRKLLCSQCS